MKITLNYIKLILLLLICQWVHSDLLYSLDRVQHLSFFYLDVPIRYSEASVGKFNFSEGLVGYILHDSWSKDSSYVNECRHIYDIGLHQWTAIRHRLQRLSKVELIMPSPFDNTTRVRRSLSSAHGIESLLSWVTAEEDNGRRNSMPGQLQTSEEKKRDGALFPIYVDNNNLNMYLKRSMG